jgi:hypothetical protein
MSCAAHGGGPTQQAWSERRFTPLALASHGLE